MLMVTEHDLLSVTEHDLLLVTDDLLSGRLLQSKS